MEQHEQDAVLLLDDDHSRGLSLLSSLSWWKLKMISKIIHGDVREENAAIFEQQRLLQTNEDHDEHHHHGHDDSSTFFSSSWRSILRRLAEGDGDSDYSYDYELRMDYSVLAVAVLTLGLILVVEVLRHKLDHAAHNRPYFTAVLENVYAECTSML
jgi:hypothetical protein